MGKISPLKFASAYVWLHTEALKKEVDSLDLILEELGENDLIIARKTIAEDKALDTQLFLKHAESSQTCKYFHFVVVQLVVAFN